MFHDANKQPGVCFLSALDPRSSGLSIGSTSIIQQYHVFMYAVILLTGRRAHYCFMFPVGSLCKVQTRGNSLLLSAESSWQMCSAWINDLCLISPHVWVFRFSRWLQCVCHLAHLRFSSVRCFPSGCYPECISSWVSHQSGSKWWDSLPLICPPVWCFFLFVCLFSWIISQVFNYY